METLHYSLMKAHATLNRRVLARAAGLGLTPGQPKILDYLIDHEGHDQKTIAAYCEIEPATVGSILLGMEETGLIVRRQHPGNRRSLFVYLTEKGREAAEAMAEVFAELEAQATRSFSPEETIKDRMQPFLQSKVRSQTQPRRLQSRMFITFFSRSSQKVMGNLGSFS